MNKIISKTIKIIANKLPPDAEFIEKEIIKNKINPLRWAIVKIEDDLLTLSVSGEEIL